MWVPTSLLHGLDSASRSDPPSSDDYVATSRQVRTHVQSSVGSGVTEQGGATPSCSRNVPSEEQMVKELSHASRHKVVRTLLPAMRGSR
jgi:hypothetical protein